MKSIERSRKLRALMKKEIFPWLEARGFKPLKHSGLWYDFLRQQDDQLQMVEIQWDKYHRPRFAVNFGRAPIVMQDGQTGYNHHLTGVWFPIDEVYCAQMEHKQLAHGRPRRQWFRYTWLASLLPSGGPHTAVASALALLPVVEGWFADDPASIAFVDSMNVYGIINRFKKYPEHPGVSLQ